IPESGESDVENREPNISPLARALAVQAGITAADIRNSGVEGCITRQHIEKMLGRASTSVPAVQSPARLPAGDGEADVLPLDTMRKTIARRMTQSFRDVPHFPLTIETSVAGVLSLREKLNGCLEREGAKLSLNDLLIKICALALMSVPDANVS